MNDHQTKLPCPVCGESSYSWGSVAGHYPLKYKDEDVGFWEKHTAFGGARVKVRKCNTCRNLQLFINTEE